jgi:tetrahydromethanopterin S-methyltransferase subunit C
VCHRRNAFSSRWRHRRSQKFLFCFIVREFVSVVAKVKTTLLDVMGVVVKRLDDSAVSDCLPIIASAMTRCMPDVDIVVRVAVMQLAMLTMQAASPSAVLDAIVKNVSSRNPRVRQSTIDVVTAALLTHPSNAFDLASLSRTVAHSLIDQKKVSMY